MAAGTIVEDAQDGTTERWNIYDSSPSGATVQNLSDGNERFIALTGTGTANGFRLGSTSAESGGLNLADSSIATWRMRASDKYVLYIAIDTAEGFRYLKYNQATRTPRGSDTTISGGLGAQSIDGTWHNYTLDLQEDLSTAQPGNTLLAVQGVYVRGTMDLDDITFSARQPQPNQAPTAFAGNDRSITLGQSTILNGSQSADPEGGTLTFLWADQSAQVLSTSSSFSWEPVSEGDFTVTLTVTDTEGASSSDSVVVNVSSPAVEPPDNGSSTVLVEDAQDGRTERWNIFDDSPNGADIENNAEGSERYISLIGTGTSNGFSLGSTSTSSGGLNLLNRTLASWRMRANNKYVIYFAIDTSEGFRYLKYNQATRTPRGSGTTITGGLGAQSIDGTWHSYTLDMQGDLSSAQPGNTLLAIQGVYIRGSMDIDDVAFSGLEPEIPNTPNLPPVADAGNALSFTVGDPQILDGSGSSDSDGTIATYAWSVAGTVIATGVNPTLANALTEGVHTITLTVTDDLGATATDTVTVTVEATPNLPPVAEAGESLTLAIGDPQILDGSGSSDSDGTIATYEWSVAGTVIATGVNPTLANALAEGVHTITLTVTDDLGATATDTVTVTVEATPNLPPVAEAGADQSITLGDTALLDGSASTDPEEQTLNYRWTDEAEQVLGSEATLSWLAESTGSFTFMLTVRDEEGESSTDTVLITVEQPQVVPDIDINGYELVFEDDFTGSTLDSSKWDTALLWGPYHVINNEEQLYVDTLGMQIDNPHSPFELTGDTLKITATPVSESVPIPERPPEDSELWHPREYSEYRQSRTVGEPGDENYDPGFQASKTHYLSGVINSYGTFNIAHGYVEMRAKLPAGRGLWPALWMLPQHYVQDVPEIDVMEFLGKDVDRLYHTYHYFDITDNWRKVSTPSFQSLATDWTQEFHTFGMAWTPTNIVWYVNGQEAQRISRDEYRIPNQAMHLIANLAVGGAWAESPDENTLFPATFEIDYIRAYKRKQSEELDIAADFQLMFEDDFIGDALDPEKWNTHFLWGPYLPINNEKQYYVDSLGSDTGSDSPFTIEEGVLSITARKITEENDLDIPQTLPSTEASVWADFPTFQRNLGYTAPEYSSGIITSYDSFKFAYGYAEIRARIPKGTGLWPAFWLLNGYYVNKQPEIDILEVRGELPNEIVHTYHYFDGTGVLQSNSATTTKAEQTGDYSEGFHTYGARWQPGKVDWYIDGEKVHTYESAEIGYQVMYVIANLAVGGNFHHTPTVDDSVLPASLDIDYIRVYQEKATP